MNFLMREVSKSFAIPSNAKTTLTYKSVCHIVA